MVTYTEHSDEDRQEVRQRLSKDYVHCTKEPQHSHWLKKGEVLTDLYGAEVLHAKLKEDPEEKCHDLALFRGIGEDPHDFVKTVQDECRERWSGYSPPLSANHLAGVHVDPATGDVGGQGITFGSGEGGPVAFSNSGPPTRPSSPEGAGVTVGCFDTGIADHEWLSGGFLSMPEDRVVPGDGTDEMSAHGTFITGLILQQAPGATVLVKKVLSPDGFTDSFRLACEIYGMADKGIDVLNLSMGFYTHANEAPLSMRLALAYLGARTQVVAAAGNHNPKDAAACDRYPRPFWPAAFGSVVAVGASDRIRGTQPVKLAEFTNRGPWVDVWVRGVDLASTMPSGDGKKDQWATWSGTSFSTAVVSGQLAATMTREGGISAPEAWKRLLKAGGPTIAEPDAHARPVLDLWPPAALKHLGRTPKPAKKR